MKELTQDDALRLASQISPGPGCSNFQTAIEILLGLDSFPLFVRHRLTTKENVAGIGEIGLLLQQMGCLLVEYSNEKMIELVTQEKRRKPNSIIAEPGGGSSPDMVFSDTRIISKGTISIKND